MSEKNQDLLPDDALSDRQLMLKVILTSTEATIAVNNLKDEVGRQRHALRQVVKIGLVLVLLAGYIMLDNHRQITALQSQFCPVVTRIAYAKTPPPPGPAGQRTREVVEEFRLLGMRFNCPVPR